ncbi:MAG: DUF1015 domain-containing protein [Gammaproteobacteria bacterium]|nr:DUF1015 domain-containing protein [Gammaproteobacteria bacterium]MXY91750.1 DUF1015 domain-containing protein [Gammaproteobacteria bacterium]MYA67618.1 DUF1015 domain-containing protein [Gammaproteobacteria bacterium]MYE30762.1 DUF1015 domain-containing protein [Gammaproteobacteria bacterium]MYF00560.1 DUF1015 domain-containing protein [Gammaproteobacteria bacterium]
MRLVRPFRGLRPAPEFAARVASPPYDVLSREEALEMARGSQFSFLHINKPEIDVDPAIDAHDRIVYARGRANLDRFIDSGVLVRDEANSFYVYRQIMGDHVQAGLAALASLEAYEQGLVKKHELTRPPKVYDRVSHMHALGAQVGPVFVTYRAQQSVDELIADTTGEEPEYDFTADDGIRHTFWAVSQAERVIEFQAALDELPALYVADGHHRSEAAAKLRETLSLFIPRRTGTSAWDWFLVVMFPHDQIKILDYNRVVRDLNGLAAGDFLQKLERDFELTEVEAGDAKPAEPREFALYLGRHPEGRWLRLRPRQAVLDSLEDKSASDRLDVALLQDWVFAPLLGIMDQRIDERVDFVGGIRGLEELERKVDSGAWSAAFALYPTSMESLMEVADSGGVMPPKSTWFEPKLRSGLVSHVLD